MTIFALSTANGIAGLAVVRVSGHLALTALKTISRKSHFDPNVLTRTSFYDSENGNLIDRGLAVYFAKPKSFTGEDVVEFHIHGGRATVDLLIKTLSGINQLRLAEPGEFSKRAFINNKMDLTAIEAMGDLINAQTELQHNQALSQMDGSLNKLYLSWRKSLIELVAYLEADIDFAEEDIPDDVLKNINEKIEKLLAEMNEHINQRNQGEILRDGYRVAIVGTPNVGKSSLINLLANRDVAIVSDREGTTRDALEVRLNIAGFPVVFTDTAGLRQTSDEIEKKGIEITQKKIDEANLVIELFDDPTKLNFHEERLTILNKCDLNNKENKTYDRAINISVTTGDGIDHLIKQISDKVSNNFGSYSDTIPTKTRYILGVQNSIQSLLNAKTIDLKSNSELMVEELRLAIQEIGKITGHVDVEEYLEVIFKDFCIGK
ncbi:tRNA uridine-5-carboxymethylaminomethyl(34) synthesis GTPase MnmE [Pelagibacterales bacterium SAG-MED32]|nr:tRNA uridine-5-carboxymethylaminomethyl(34) synthesis GTPase MnmE [Pelagibacterales bacterium SAG-MED32]